MEETGAVFHKKIVQYERTHKTVPSNSSVLIACSGGPDSVGLLFWLAQFKNKEPHTNLRLGIAIVDHSLRAESKAEVELVKCYGAQLQLPVYVKVIDAQQEADKAKKSVETISRELRYEFFHQIMATEGYEYLATAHHLDDQAETILSHLLRGSGSKGLTGMYPVMDYKWRPFLGVTKQDILDFVNELGLQFALDKTNDEPLYRRNKLRLEGIPYLRQYNPNLTETLGRLGEAMQADETYLTDQAMEAMQSILIEGPVEYMPIKPNKGEKSKAIHKQISKRAVLAVPQGSHTECKESEVWILRRAEFHDLPDALYYRIWRYIMECIQPRGTFSMAQVKQLRQITAGTSPKQINLGQVKVTAQYGIIQIGRFTIKQNRMAYKIGSKRLVHWQGPEQEALPLVGNESILIPQSMAEQGPIVRLRQPGDRVALRDASGRIWGHKKLKDWLIDRKIPREQRPSMWFCCADFAVIDSLDRMKAKPIVVWDEASTKYWACSIEEELI